LWQAELKNVKRIAVMYLNTFVLNTTFINKTFRTFPRLEEVVFLWEDGTGAIGREGRGVNYIEEMGHEGNEAFEDYRDAVGWKECIEEGWRRDRTWEKLGRERPPVITVRHWCRRVEREW
jgi:hypothetical protein